MNLNVLRYAIEVERSRSITAAARQLFISQPNLSRDIRELEEEIGFSIFTRSSRGVIPTEKGREFLQLARKAVRQYQTLENFCSREERGSLSLQVCIPRASYIAAAFQTFLIKYVKSRRLHIDYHETEAMEAIQNVILRTCSIAIIRYPDRFERTLFPLLKRKELAFEPVCRFEPVAVMSDRHPLAGTTQLLSDMLEQYVEVLCEDNSLTSWLHETPETEHTGSFVRVHERGSQLELLSRMPGAFAFMSPLPDDLLEKVHLVQKKCQGQSRKMTDLLIYPEDYRLTRMEQAFVDTVRSMGADKV